MRNLRNNELHFALGPAFTTWKVGYECWIFKLFSPFFKVQNKRTCTILNSFNIASEASYVYILSRQKFTKNAKNSPFGEVLKT